MSDRANSGIVASGLTPPGEFDARLKRADENRWLASRYAPGLERERLVAVYLLNHELQRALGVSEPMLGKIRLQWWRETLDSIAAGTPRRHDLAIELARTIANRSDLLALLNELIDRFDDVIEDHLHAGGHNPESAHEARHAAAEAALTRLAGAALEKEIAPAHLETLARSGEAHLAVLADLPDAPKRFAEAAKLTRDLPAPLWPAIAHLAAVRKVGAAEFGPLRKRWRILQAVLRRRL